MTKTSKSPLKLSLDGTKIKELAFESIKPPSSKPVDFELSIALGFNHFDKEKRLICLIGIKITGDDVPFKLSIKYEGFFSLNRRATKKEIVPYAKVNCNAILFPFVREVIADITRRAGYAPFILEPINFVEIAKQSEKKDLQKQPAAKS